MLVLTRKLGEDILIGEDILVKVVNIEKNKVQLGIKAPSTVAIYRQELVEKVKKQNQASIIYQKRDFLNASKLLKNILTLKM